MCGIAGSYRWHDGARITRAMADALSHRGPDAHGCFDYQHGDVQVSLAHRRLAIIDLTSAADQPFTKHGLTLCYNGELYNFRELREELAKGGTQFSTSSDTEVVLESWNRWGPGCLSRFRGMFAFALFDERTGRLVLARDQLGIKPLYYLYRDGALAFASELKAIARVLGSSLRIDAAAVVASILYYWVPDQRCALEGVQKLPPGSWAEILPNGTLSVHRYWDIAEVAATAAEEPPPDLRQVVQDSVSAHLVSDAPVSTFLSGGLDSSIVTVLAHRQDPSIDAYTIRFRREDQLSEAMPDDARYARRVARQFGIALHEIEIAPDIVDLLPRMVDVLDEPIGDPAAINTLLICESARVAGVKVLLSGMGADELFGGYRKHVACLMASHYRRVPRGVRRYVVEPAVDRLPVTVGSHGVRPVRWAKRFLTFAELPEEAAFRRSYTLYGADDALDVISPDLKECVADVVQEHSEVYSDTALLDQVNRMCLADARLFLPGLNLAYTDRASMAASTEVRVPFVDVDVVRAAFAVRGSAKIRGRHGKLALKAAAEDWLPREVVYRPKASFGAPIRAWVGRDLRGFVDDVLLDGELVRTGVLQHTGVARLVEDDRLGRQDRAKQIWQLLSLELWYRHMTDLGVGGLAA
jgi:asparagine synthase (glutamine-hydrolysing)